MNPLLPSGALAAALSVLLALPAATDRAAAGACSRIGFAAKQWDWVAEADRTAAALLPLLHRIPALEPDMGPSTSAAAAAGPSPSLLALLPQLLAASGALQRSRFAVPSRRSALALLCSCLAAVCSSAGVSAEQRQQAVGALLRLALSPVAASELQHSEFASPATRQMAQCVLDAAANVLESGAAAAGYGGQLAYLATNLLAYSAGLPAFQPLQLPKAPAAGGTAAGNTGGGGAANNAQSSADHASW